MSLDEFSKRAAKYEVLADEHKRKGWNLITVGLYDAGGSLQPESLHSWPRWVLEYAIGYVQRSKVPLAIVRNSLAKDQQYNSDGGQQRNGFPECLCYGDFDQ
ncbi:uncharacterized protein KY384_007443 [Bacidia gigantensis]|uniref:uncharacterized protein n=1 Tax=Bacidia gigantensis TaxID=2732470 RepID=UPI001D03617D|nr:uncharacterized protein KY384_007443 [Bacidia gigantensis]KAG8528525.1 hypothetical protein KY384_007443 [Bacidia gigantensis]